MYNNLDVIEGIRCFLKADASMCNVLGILGYDKEKIISMVEMYINFISLREYFIMLNQKDKMSEKDWYDMKLIAKKLNRLQKRMKENNPRSKDKRSDNMHRVMFYLFEDIMLFDGFHDIMGYKLPDTFYDSLENFYLNREPEYETNGNELNLLYAIKAYDIFNRAYNESGIEGITRLVKLDKEVEDYSFLKISDYENNFYSLIALIYKKNFVSHKFKENDEQVVLDRVLLNLVSNESFLNLVPKNKKVEILVKVFWDHYEELIKGKSYEEIIEKFNNILANYKDNNIIKASNTKPKVLCLEK